MAKDLKIRRNYPNDFLHATGFFLDKTRLLQLYSSTMFPNLKDYEGRTGLS
jgi:hypothetical protein